MADTLSAFFTPKTVAIIGASTNPQKLSHGIVDNLLNSGYQGEILPINPNASEILGLKCYPDLASIGRPVDLAVIILPAPLILPVVEECGQNGVKAVTVISGGFKEVGGEGVAREEELLGILKKFKMRMIGPNCVGTMNLLTGLNTTFIRGAPVVGGIGFISQSGAICGGIVDYIAGKNIGFSHFLSLGNMADVTETDMIEYLGQDKDTRVIAAYVEGVKDGERFLKVSRAVCKTKPIVVLKAGRSSEGAKAVSSHTGSLAGSHAAYQAAFKQSGIYEVFNTADLLNCSMALDWQPLPQGNRAVIVTNSGGPAALASDSFSEYGVQLAQLSDSTREEIAKGLNPAAQVGNPIDMLGGATETEYAHALNRALSDDGVDMALAILVPTSLVDPVAIAREFIQAAKNTGKPLFVCLMGYNSTQEARRVLHENIIPTAEFPSSVGVMFGALLNHAENQKKGQTDQRLSFPAINEGAPSIFSAHAGLKHWGEHQTRQVLAEYKIPLVEGALAADEKEAALIGQKLGYPLVLKGASSDILHKTDAQAVKIGIRDETEFKRAYNAIMKNMLSANPEARIDGILIESMAPEGLDVILGMKRDPGFGPLMMFGMGGIFVELFKDVAFRVAPVNEADILEMIRETKAHELLNGWRGGLKYDLPAIIDTIEKLSQLVVDFPEIQEIEINPLRVFPDGKGVLALDSRMILA